MLRRLRQSGLCLVVGAVSTFLVAWALLATVDLRTVAAQGKTWYRGAPKEWPSPGSLIVRVGTGVRLVEQANRPAEPQAISMWTLPPDPVTLKASALECGWPWVALRSTQWGQESGSTGKLVLTPVQLNLWLAGLPVRWRDLPIGAAGQPRLPVQPLWPGFALDAAIFALGAAVLSRMPRAVRWLYRRRCGLCPACGYVVAVATVCSECGGPVQPWKPTPGPPLRSLDRPHRRIAAICAAASVAAIILYILSGGWGLYLKAPGGWYTAVWHGQLALGRSDHPFQTIGLEVSRFAAPFSLRFHWQAELVGRILSVPLWLPLPALGVVAVGAWWRAAVRRGLAQHWPAPTAGANEDAST